MNELTSMSSNHPTEKLNISEIYVKLIFCFIYHNMNPNSHMFSLLNLQLLVHDSVLMTLKKKEES